MVFGRHLFGTVIVGASVLMAVSAQADTITLRADAWCPYNCSDSEAQPGYGIEIAREVFAKAGHVIDYKLIPWTRALDDCRKGEIAAVIGTNQVESPDFVFPEQAIGSSDNTLIVRKDNPWRYSGVASLENIKLGVVVGYVYDGEMGSYVDNNLNKKARIDSVGGDTALAQNIKKILLGRIDATLDTKAVLAYTMTRMGVADQLTYAGSETTKDIFLAFSPANPKSKDYAALFDRGLTELRVSGRLAEILRAYGLSDWQ